ncbi:Putative phage protein [Gluconobacter oxydans 621H]|uniref:Putative phage protein n=1 Tax=Gluconobacter oxydans (strain 621H) TaxID=290633 RepID=Q5FNI6_GLUOX|nr:hypothetical protein [Gluconobacter oxydans]AAW62061.1 Putative phage protein [Gluconobacter oxydans 621H]
MVESLTYVPVSLDGVPLKVLRVNVEIRGRRIVRNSRPFNAKAILESARIKPDLHNQVRRFSSGMTLVEGGRMRLPAQWGSGRG